MQVIVEACGWCRVAYTYDAVRHTPFIRPLAQSSEFASGGRSGVFTLTRFDPAAGGKLPNDLWNDFVVPVGTISAVQLSCGPYHLPERIQLGRDITE